VTSVMVTGGTGFWESCGSFWIRERRWWSSTFSRTKRNLAEVIDKVHIVRGDLGMFRRAADTLTTAKT
jgi:hypothetical protein